MKQLDSSDQLYVYELPKGEAFHIIPLSHLQTASHCYPLMQGLELLYHEKEEKVRIKQRSGDIAKIVKQELHRNSAKLPKLKEAFHEAMDCETYREYGDLLFAYMDAIQREPLIILPSFESGEDITIPLDIRYDIKQNANRYYQKYHKAKRAQAYLTEQIALCEKQIAYFEALQLQLEQASVQDAMEIREELIRLHYMQDSGRHMRRNKKNQVPHFACFAFEEAKVYVGKNNLQNDYVTWKLARKSDTWLHAKDMHGAHVIITTDSPSETLLRDAAMLAAWYSAARYSSSVPINYCLVRQLKKIPGNQGSFVSLSNYKTIYIDPQSDHIKELIKTYASK